MSQSTPHWSSRAAFYLAAIGAAVGLGSIWRLPYQAGTNGGSAFVIVFTVACLVIATPLLVAEFLLGRRAQMSPPEAVGEVAHQAGRGRHWNFVGIIGTISGLLVMGSYTLVGGWVLAYAMKCASGRLSGLDRAAVGAIWQAFQASPAEMGAWHAAFLGVAAYISARGVGKGIEVATRIREPLLLGLLSGLAVYALLKGDAAAGLRFAFVPDFSAITPAVALSAVGQAFYATGVGASMMIAYGAYVAPGTSLVRAALIITGSILLVSLLATLMIFPLVFRFGMNPAQGPELVFDVLATVFAQLPAGRLVGTLFFLLLFFAAVTPTVGGLEPMVAWLVERCGWSRPRAVLATFGAAWIIGFGSLFGFTAFFQMVDFVPTNILMPVGALGTSILVGWLLPDAILAPEFAETTPFARRWCLLALRYLCPLGIVGLGLATLFGS